MRRRRKMHRERPVIALFTDAKVVGGAERSLLQLIEAFDGGANLVLVSTVDAVLDDAARRSLAVRRVRVPDGSTLRSAFAELRATLRSLKPDLLHVNMPYPFAARAAVLAGYSLGIPVTTTEHLMLPSERRRERLLKRALSLPLSAQVVVGHRTAHELIDHYGLRASTVRVVHNGIGDDPVVPVEYNSRPVIGCAARFESQKHLGVLVRAMVELPDARLVLVGDGSLRDELVDLAAIREVADRVTFAGWVVDARAHIAGFDVFVLPSLNEAFPLTILEAMLGRTPVVATDVGSVHEAVRDGETGFLVPSGDLGALVGAIRRMLDDEALRVRMVSAARSMAVERFSAATMATGYDAIWSEVLRRRRRPP